MAVADLAAGSLVASSLPDSPAAALAAALNQPRVDGAATAPSEVLPVLF